MEYTEEKMIEVFIRRFKSSKDIVTEKKLVMKFIELHGLSIFKFINRLRKADEEICDRFTGEYKEVKKKKVIKKRR